MIGLLLTGDGIPIAHHVFPGNTADVTTLTEVMADYQARFGVWRIALVADRGLISEENVASVEAAGFDHVIATRLHNDNDVKDVLEKANSEKANWVELSDLGSRATEVEHDGRRFVVVDSPARKARDDAREEELMVRAEDKLIALSERVRRGRLADKAKIGAAADRILRDSGVGRCFSTYVEEGLFHWAYDEGAYAYDTELLAGRYVIATSLHKHVATTAEIVYHYRALQRVERRFRVLKDFLGLRPVYHFTENRVRGHIAICVLAAVIEAVMAKDLAAADVRDPDLARQVITPRRALSRARPDPTRQHRGERTQPRPHHPPQRLAGEDPLGPRRRHLCLGQGRHHLNACYGGRCSGNTSPARPCLPALSRSGRRSRVRDKFSTSRH